MSSANTAFEPCAITEGLLACPFCGDTVTHLDTAYVASRQREDGPLIGIVVHRDGSIVRGDSDVVPQGDFIHEGRRHRIAMSGYCEACLAAWSYVFAQHKGSTFIEIVRDEDVGGL